jgi:D-alanyl-D-alanine carboxypeptidase
MRLGLTCATLLALVATLPAGSAHGQAPARADVEQVARSLVRDGAPGAVVALRTTGGIGRAAAGVARIRPREPLRATDRYRIASVTKPFVATVVLQLVAERRIRLADSVERWLPGLVPNGRAITLRELLGHTSGLFDYDDDAAWVRARIADPGRAWSAETLVGIATRHRPRFPPGTDWAYSNTNYVLLGLVVEAATKHTPARELGTRIIAPLALRATSYPQGTAIQGRVAHGYQAAAPGLPIPAGRLLDVTSRVSPSAWGAGQMVSNADDLTRFFGALLAGRVLHSAQLREMKAEVRGDGIVAFRVPYGLGLDIEHTPCGVAYGHVGDMPGYRNVVWASADGRRVAAVMVNVAGGRLSWDAIRRAAATAFCSG